MTANSGFYFSLLIFYLIFSYKFIEEIDMKNTTNIKLSIYSNQRIVIEDYNRLLDLSENLIKVDIFSIYGKFLKLKQMDSYMIEIFGDIHQVIINE